MEVNELIKLLAAKDEQINQLLERLTNMQAQLDNLLRMLYGKKSEKTQTTADIINTEIVKNNSGAKSDGTKTKPVRKKLPDNLPREDIRYELYASACVSQG